MPAPKKLPSEFRLSLSELEVSNASVRVWESHEGRLSVDRVVHDLLDLDVDDPLLDTPLAHAKLLSGVLFLLADGAEQKEGIFGSITEQHN